MTTYTTLLADVAAWTAEDLTESQIQSFIRLCEAEMRRDVRTRDQEVTTTLTCTDRETALPANLLHIRSLTKQGPTDDRVLHLMTPEKIREEIEWQDSDGTTAYSIEGNNIVVAPAPGTEPLILDIVYSAAYDAITPSNPTNWLLTNAYDVYLYGTLKAAYSFLEDNEQFAKYQALYVAAVEPLNSEQKLGRLGGSSIARRGVVAP